ncbi:hypothetical protein [Croceibacterium atlanticum]|nr:hypothetical protein [Croceibacterium atlanticum]
MPPESGSGIASSDTATTPPEDELGSDAVMQGEWISKQLAGNPAVLFGPPGTEASFSVGCEDGELVFSRSVLVEPGETDMRLMAGGEIRTLDGTAQAEPLPRVTARLPAGDPFATILAGLDAPFAVSVAGGPSFRMPPSDAFRRVVADCRG